MSYFFYFEDGYYYLTGAGTALMAALGTGALESFDALADVIEPGRIVQPDAERHRAYEKYRRVYDSLYAATRDLMHELP